MNLFSKIQKPLAVSYTHLLSALLTAGGFLVCEPLMRLLGTPENVFADSQLYLNVYVGCLLYTSRCV